MNLGDTTMRDVIAQQLAGLYLELTGCQSFSSVARIELSEAAASGRASLLLICECNTDGLELCSIFRRWWVVDATGFHSDEKWPFTKALIEHDGWEAEFPFVKFATDGHRIRFGLRFGPDWYVVKEGPLGADGRFVPDQLFEKHRCIG